MEEIVSGRKITLKKNQRSASQKNLSQEVWLIGVGQFLSGGDVLVRFRKLLEIAVRQPSEHLFPDRSSTAVKSYRKRCIEQREGVPA